jgi:CRP-like cAMP-binding protein
MTIDSRIYLYVVEEESYPDKAVIVQEGRHGDWMYLLLEGQVKVKRNTEKGTLNLATLGEGDIFGESAFLQNSDKKRSVSVVANGPVVVGLLDMQQLGAVYNDLPGLLRRLLSKLAQRVDDSIEQLVALATQK